MPTTQPRGGCGFCATRAWSGATLSEIIGYNARMTDLHAAIGRVQLRRLPEWTAARRRNAEFLTGGPEQVVPQDLLSVPRVAPSAQPVWHQYTGRVPQRDQLAATLAGLGIQTGIYYPTPIHRLPAFDLDLDLPRTATAAQEVLLHRRSIRHCRPRISNVLSVLSPRRWRNERHPARRAHRPRRMGRNHMRVLQSLADVELVAAVDPLGRAHHASMRSDVLHTVRELIDRGIDFCVVATPTRTHQVIGQELAEAGVPALIEKPLAHDGKAAQAIVEAFARNGVLGCVGHIERFNPALQDLRRRLACGELGALYELATRRQQPFPVRISDTGVILDLATHDIDLTAWVTGSTYRSVSARVAHRCGKVHEDLMSAVAELSSGIVATHLADWLSPFKERVTTVTGEHGCFVADTLTTDIRFYQKGRIIRYAIPKSEPLMMELSELRGCSSR